MITKPDEIRITLGIVFLVLAAVTWIGGANSVISKNKKRRGLTELFFGRDWTIPWKHFNRAERRNFALVFVAAMVMGQFGLWLISAGNWPDCAQSKTYSQVVHDNSIAGGQLITQTGRN